MEKKAETQPKCSVKTSCTPCLQESWGEIKSPERSFSTIGRSHPQSRGSHRHGARDRALSQAKAHSSWAIRLSYFCRDSWQKYAKIYWGLSEPYTLTFLYFSFYLSIIFYDLHFLFLLLLLFLFVLFCLRIHSTNIYRAPIVFPSPILSTRDTKAKSTVPFTAWSLHSPPILSIGTHFSLLLVPGS